jgi:hypothetical protein
MLAGSHEKHTTGSTFRFKGGVMLKLFCSQNTLLVCFEERIEISLQILQEWQTNREEHSAWRSLPARPFGLTMTNLVC